MNNCEKLLRAFIEGDGFDITKEFDQRRYNYEVALANERNEAPILTKADFTDYKVTKKPVDTVAASQEEFINKIMGRL